MEDYTGSRYSKLIALASHVLNQNGEMQLPATGDLKDGVIIGIADT